MSAKKLVQRDTREFVRIGYNDACINFRVQFSRYEFDELAQCIRNVTQYNAYQGVVVARAFEKIKGLVNKAAFGREGSPVLYLYLNPHEWVEAKNEWVKYAPEVMAAQVEQVRKAFSKTEVDEFYTMDEGHNDNLACVRLWWD